VQSIYDTNQQISDGKPYIRFVCVIPNDPWPTDPENDPDGINQEMFETSLQDCAGDSLKNMAITKNWDRIDPDCLPAIYICESFIVSGLFLNTRTTEEWCSVDFDTDDPAADEEITTWFPTFALTLMHEATHVDVVIQGAQPGVPNIIGLGGMGEGELETEIYPHSDCRDLSLDDDFATAEQNAESHALSWLG
jgi:hypothetical protein